MPLSEQLARHATDRLAARRALLGEKLAQAEAALATLDADEAALTRFFLGSLPLTDVVDTPLDLLVSYARHALMLRREVPWCAELPEEVFVHYVAFPRINNEPLEDVRPALWEELYHRIAGMDAQAAVVEVNYWCAEHATYRSSDARTLGARGVLAAATGRCGEESTLLVTALRAVGIPARQIYVPLWAHCDDNHAWVEAYAGGAWHYLGACEPEEALDRGWFTAAAGRAPLVAATTFSDFGLGEEAVARDGGTWIVNVTRAYAPVARLDVTVTLPDGSPAAGSVVCLEVLNSCAWRPLATLVSDESGRCGLELGLCCVRAHASRDGLRAEKVVEVPAEGLGIGLELGACAEAGADGQHAEAAADGRWLDVDVPAPADHPAPSQALTPEQVERGRARKAAADNLRRERVAAMRAHAAELAARAAKLRPEDDAAEVARILDTALGNADEVFSFLTADGKPERLSLLRALAPKDYLDLRADVLEGHLLAALARLGDRPRTDVWERFVLCPRVGAEHLSRWRPELAAALDAVPELRELLVAEKGVQAWAWMLEHLGFSPLEHLAKLVGTPAGALASGQASLATRRVLFVAACRTLGVPARLSPTDGRAEMLVDGRFCCVEGSAASTAAEATHTLRLTADAGRALIYWVDWTLARLGDSMLTGGQTLTGFFPLNLSDQAFVDGTLELELPEGTYRAETSVRLPNGRQLSSERVFELSGPRELELRVRTPATDELLQRIPLSGLLPDSSGAAEKELVAFLELAEEPTEHLLNELADSAAGVVAAGLALTLVTREDQATAEKDPTLARALAALAAAGATVALAQDDFSELPERCARRMFANPEALPLTLLVDHRGDEPIGLFARGGYAVGTVELALRLAAL